MSCPEHNTRTSILRGLQIDSPVVFLPWDTDENGFLDLFKYCNVSIIADKNYAVNDITVFGEEHCTIGVTFEKAICKVGVSRNFCNADNSLKDKSIITTEDFSVSLKKSFKAFQASLEKSFGKPSRQRKNPDGFESCEWDIGNEIRVYHSIMDRFGLAEFLFIEKD